MLCPYLECIVSIICSAWLIFFMSVSFFIFFLTAVDFFNQINMLYGTITDFCTEESCPVMSAGPK